MKLIETDTRFCSEENEITRRDYFAVHAPPAEQEWLTMEMQRDRAANPHNESHRPYLRSRLELQTAWNYKWADAMLKAREKPHR